MDILRVERVSKNFGAFAALHEVDLTLRKGDILGMIGPNGSGKTTLFNVISGMIPPTSGRVLYKDEAITGKKPHVICRMGIARTFQIVQPFARMTVLDNVMVGAIYGGGLHESEARKRSNEAIDMVGLTVQAKLTPGHMTTSDRRRLELARALATGPEVILLDEMMAGLTPSEVEDVLQLLRDIRDRGISIFMIEHIMRAVMSICDRVVVLNHGEKIAEGAPGEVTSHSEVIKAYLGERYA